LHVDLGLLAENYELASPRIIPESLAQILFGDLAVSNGPGCIQFHVALCRLDQSVVRVAQIVPAEKTRIE
jgi:hypothetical protein